MVDRRSFASPDQSTLQNPLKATSLPLKHNLKSKMPLKYLVMRFTTIQCGGLIYDMNWFIVLTANARSLSALISVLTWFLVLTLSALPELECGKHVTTISSSSSR